MRRAQQKGCSLKKPAPPPRKAPAPCGGQWRDESLGAACRSFYRLRSKSRRQVRGDGGVGRGWGKRQKAGGWLQASCWAAQPHGGGGTLPAIWKSPDWKKAGGSLKTSPPPSLPGEYHQPRERLCLQFICRMILVAFVSPSFSRFRLACDRQEMHGMRSEIWFPFGERAVT